MLKQKEIIPSLDLLTLEMTKLAFQHFGNDSNSQN